MKILVVIDNHIQYDRIKAVFESSHNLLNFQVDYKHSIEKSAIWEHPDFKNKESCTIDVKKDCDLLIRDYDLIFSIHCFQFFPEKLVKNVRCINIHPGYNPTNRGWYPQVFAIINNLPIGATIHEMDEKLDNGPIIAREYVEKFDTDTSESLYNRVLIKEIELFKTHFLDICNNNYRTITPELKGNFYSKSDFYDLCKLDLNKTGTFKEFYDLLRALSHGKYNNAYFYDENNNSKHFVKLHIDSE